VPNEYADLAVKVMEFHTHCHRVLELKARTLLSVLESLGAFRQAEKLDDFLLACEADSKGRLGLEENAYPQADWIRRVYQATGLVNAAEFIQQGLVGKQIGEAISAKRIQVIDGLNKDKP
jgi:tRNA nucleotidyltransferase (CCA-adding enzyme)